MLFNNSCAYKHCPVSTNIQILEVPTCQIVLLLLSESLLYLLGDVTGVMCLHKARLVMSPRGPGAVLGGSLRNRSLL